MRILFLSLILTFVLQGYSQTIKDLHFKEVGWTVHIPANTPALDHHQVDSLWQSSQGKIHAITGKVLDFSVAHPLFDFLDKEYNAFGSTINSFDSTHFSSWAESYDSSRAAVLRLMYSMAPRVRILDTAYSEEYIDGILFKVVRLKAFYPQTNITMDIYWFCCLRKGYDLSINISFTNKEKGGEFLNITRHSSFEKTGQDR